MDQPAAACPPPRFAHASCIDRDHPRRGEVERFVRRVYRLHYGARLQALMPRVLAFADQAGGLDAAVGLRFGAEGPLFAEHYLAAAADVVLAGVLGEAVARGSLVELGNFAAGSPGAARRMILSIIPLLSDTGARRVLFVATRQLRNAFARLGIPTHPLAPARPECLGRDAARWGRYYDAEPMLVHGDLHEVLPPRPATVLATHCEPVRLACGAAV